MEMETFLVAVVAVTAGIGSAWIYSGFPTKSWREALKTPLAVERSADAAEPASEHHDAMARQAA